MQLSEEESRKRERIGKHKQVDDTTYGGGNGMVLRVDESNGPVNISGKSVRMEIFIS